MTATTPADETAHELRVAIRAWWPAAELEEQSDHFESALSQRLGVDVEARQAALRRSIRAHVLQLARDAEMPERMDRALLDQVGEASWNHAGDPVRSDQLPPLTADQTTELVALGVAGGLRRLADALEDIEAGCDDGDVRRVRRALLRRLAAKLLVRELPRRPLWEKPPAHEDALIDRLERSSTRFDSEMLEWLDIVIDGSIHVAVTTATPPADQRRA